MANGMALCIGLNAVDPGHYGGWDGPLVACEADAQDMAMIATAMKHQAITLLTKQATRSAVLSAIAKAAKVLAPGDLFLLTYSGHGGQLPDLNSDEDDALDETWCLYDGELVDDEIFKALGAFAPGVRIFSLSDSCHSGTVLKAQLMSLRSESAAPRYKAMPDSVVASTYYKNQAFYDPILKNPQLAEAQAGVSASAILISGCMDNQLSGDGAFNGVFTGELKRVWNGGKFSGGYRSFRDTIVKNMPASQTPNYFTVGLPHPAFEAMKPFEI